MAVQPLYMKATNAASVPAGAGSTALLVSPGRLLQVLVTASGTGTGNVVIFDNATTASGTIIGMIPATVTAPTLFSFDMPAAFGIVVQNVASGPALTVSWH
jgi:hypothetical protein